MDKKKWEQENVLRLVKKSRKGVLRVVFSRFGLMALLLILELVLLWMMWRWFNNDFEWFAAVQGIFTVLMFFHLFNRWLSRVGSGAGIGDGIYSDVVQSLQEYVFRNEALLGRIAVFSVVLDAVRNVQFVVHAAQIVNEEFYFLFRCLAAKFHLVSDHCITFCCSLVFCVERDNLRQVHSVCCAVDQVSAVISECCACFMCFFPRSMTDSMISG